MTWHGVPPEHQEQTTTTEVDCLSTEHKGVLYAAGIVYVHIGHGPAQKAVACRAGNDRRITTRDHAPEWLAEHDLPAAIARALVRDAWEQDNPR